MSDTQGTTSSSNGSNGSTASQPVSETVPEHFRILVPNPETELQLGQGDAVSGGAAFVGIAGRVKKGGVLFAAGGFPGGLQAEDGSFEQFRKAHTTISVAVSGIAAASLLFRSAYQRKEICLFDLVVNGLLGFAAPAGIGVAFGAMDNGMSSADGSIALYGDKNVAIATPMTFGATAGLAASINGGIVASLNATGAASVNAVVASVNGVWKANVGAIETNIIADSKLTLASRRGGALVAGETIQIGQATAKMPLLDRFLSGGQYGTKRVDLRADEVIHMEPGDEKTKIAGAPTKLHLDKKTVRAETTGSALTLDASGTWHAGNSIMKLSSDKLSLCFGAVAPKEASDAIIKPAEVAWKEAQDAAEEIEETVDKVGFAKAGLLLGTVAGGISTAIVGAQSMSDDQKSMIDLAALGAGMALGPLAGFGVAKAVEKVLTSKAQAAARKAADKALTAAVKGGLKAEQAAVKAQGKLPTNPAIELASSGVTLRVGKSKITISATEISIETAPGLEVKINGSTFSATGVSLAGT
ncbi:MAG: hypothetical protein U0271_10240 [Polyangiaceae bacterium]